MEQKFKPGERYMKYQEKMKKSKEKKHEKNWIAGAIKKPGALHRELGVKKGEKIPTKKLAAAAKKGGLEGKRARLAETLKSFHHKAKKHEKKGKKHEKEEKKHEKKMCKVHKMMYKYCAKKHEKE
jgi:hypothetical protein